ncbi:MAG: sulfotransferase domain-containing protein [Mucilaginibacter sp.]
MTDASVIPKKIVWLASYPKSGNTWFRAFLTALLGDGDLNINEMKTDGIFSARGIFDSCTDLDSTYLRDEEVKLLQPEVYCHLAKEYEKERLFVKVHDAYTYNELNQPIIPTPPTLCAIYLIRNPLDVVASLANHNGSTIDAAIKLMNNPKGTLARQKGNLNVNNQFSQLMLDWSGHAESWTAQTGFPVLAVRYEDMLADPLATFSRAVAFMGVDTTADKILKAIEETRFDKLKAQEAAGGFKEKNPRSESFFRSGSKGNWEKELTAAQAESILTHHADVMRKYNYI